MGLVPIKLLNNIPGHKKLLKIKDGSECNVYAITR